MDAGAGDRAAIVGQGFDENGDLPRLAALAGQIAIVVVASDRDPQDVTRRFGKLPFPVVLDPPG